jgi:arylformamidase
MCWPPSYGASIRGKNDRMAPTFIDLSHVITEGLVTYPGLPVPHIADHISREAAEEIYGAGVTFQIGTISMCSNTGTYLDTPFHRFADGHDLSALPIERVADVPAVCITRLGTAVIDLPKLGELDFEGCAILFRTDHSQYFGTERYLVDHPYISVATAEALVAANVACVGIDSLNIDAISGDAGAGRPVHTTLLRAGIPIIEHLTNLAAIPRVGFRFTAVPPKIEGMGTFAVRAFATVDDGWLGDLDE